MDRSEKYFTSTNDMFVFYLFLVLPAYTIGIDDGNGLSYHKNLKKATKFPIDGFQSY